MKHVLLALGLTIVLVTPAAAHHNWAAIYDVDGDIEIEGIISEIEFRNPHVRMSFTVLIRALQTKKSIPLKATR